MAKLDTSQLFGEIEIDETYMGGKRPGKPGRGAGGKTVVLGITPGIPTKSLPCWG